MANVFEGDSLFHKNLLVLNDLGAIQIAKSGVGIDHSPHDGPELQISGLDQSSSLKIARALFLMLDKPKSDSSPSHDMAVLNHISYPSIVNPEDSIVFYERPSGGKYSLTLGETKEGDSILQVGIAENFDGEFLKQARSDLHRAYLDVLSNLNLDPSEVNETTEESVAKVEIPVMHRLGRIGLRFRKEDIDSSADERAMQSEQAAFHFKLLGLTSSEMSDVHLIELWERVNRDPVALIDLNIFVWSDKQSGIINETYPLNDIQDLSDALSASPSLLDLRHKLQSEALEQYQKLGFQKNDIERRFQISSSEYEKLRLRYASWLLAQPFMGVARREIKSALKQGLRLENEEIYKFSYRYLVDAYKQFRELGRRDYDMTKGYHRRKSSEVNRYFRSNTLMAMHIFYGHDVKQYLDTNE